MRKMLALAAAFICTAALSACGSITLQTEDLMRPPKLSPTQSEVYSALVNALGTTAANVNLRYPRSGDYRSAFTFYDLTGDGSEEAIVFYSLTDDETALYVNILSRQSGSWQSIYDVPGLGESIDAVQFASLSQPGGRDIVIGWESGDGQLQLSVMRFDGRELRTLYEGGYTRYAIANLDADELDELVLVSMSSSGKRPYAALVDMADIDTLSAVSHVQFNLDMSSFAQILVGRLQSGTLGLLVDGYTGEQLATEVLLVREGKLVLPMDRSDEFYAATARLSGDVLCQDVNGDGILEIPVQTAAPGQEGVKNADREYYTAFCRLTAGGDLEPVTTMYLNQELGYSLTLPAGWAQGVTLSVQKATGEVRFSAYDPEDEAASTDLLKIRVYSQKDYQDKFDEQYVEIGHKGIFRYFASLPQSDSPLAISQDELVALFRLS